MYKNKKILAIIPARGGSKGIKNKNLKKIKNKSLIELTANLINKIKIIDYKIISSDNKRINQEAKKYNLNYLFDRPKILSGDRVSDIQVLNFTLRKVEKILNQKFDIILLIQVTCPLRKKIHIEKAIKLLIKKKYDAVWSVNKIDKKYHPFKQLIIKNNKLNFFDKNKGKKIIARQQLNNTFIRNGAVYAFTRSSILKNDALPDNSGFIETEELISIDNLVDLKKVEKLI